MDVDLTSLRGTGRRQGTSVVRLLTSKTPNSLDINGVIMYVMDKNAPNERWPSLGKQFQSSELNDKKIDFNKSYLGLYIFMSRQIIFPLLEHIK